MWLQVYSINARRRKIKQNSKHDECVQLDTSEFDSLLDELIEHVHARQRKLHVHENVDDFLNAEIETEMQRMADQAESEWLAAQQSAQSAITHSQDTAESPGEHTLPASDTSADEESSVAGKSYWTAMQSPNIKSHVQCHACNVTYWWCLQRNHQSRRGEEGH